ncbi:uncharacterized protein LOC142771623 [Rhipicephalus microplus]|uniref:Putative tick ixodegrin synganglion overexpressed n=2 Tax=Rhipicephalus microplus TaxID=6941 RepID=A0A6M2D3P9_RHIMP
MMSTCARSVILICACAALAAAFAAEAQFELVPDTERVEQYDVLFRQLPSRRNEVGEPCRNSNHCRRGMCCLLARNRTRTCQLMSRIGEKCTDGQVKGGAYPDHCPCLQGICSLRRDRRRNFGDNGVCVPETQGQRPVTSETRQTRQFFTP